jgi:hypothetical protein
MAYGNDARLTLTTHILLQANHFVSSIGAVTPPGFRQGSRSETLFRAGPVTTAVQLTFSSLTDSAEPEFLGTVPWLPDRTLVMYTHLTCLRCPGLYRLLCAPQVRPLWLPAVDDEEER